MKTKDKTSNYTEIDFHTWPRAQQFEHFRNCLIPRYQVGFELDVTIFKDYIKKNALSFTLALTYIVARCANRIENLRYRFLNGKVVLYSECSVSFTWLQKGSDLFKYVEIRDTESMTLNEFVKFSKNKADTQKEFMRGPTSNEAFWFTSLPFISFTTATFTQVGGGEQASATPIFGWGKYFERESVQRLEHKPEQGINLAPSAQLKQLAQ